MNMKIMYSHFQKHGYLLSDDEQKEIIKLIDVIDTITKVLLILVWACKCMMLGMKKMKMLR